jgi:hypothetical protein
VDVLSPAPGTSRWINPLTDGVEYVQSRSRLPLQYLKYTGTVQVMPLDAGRFGPVNIVGELCGRTDIPLTSSARDYLEEGMYVVPYFP